MNVSSEHMAARCRADGEFRLAARYWDGGLTIDLGSSALNFAIKAGEILPANGSGSAAEDGPSPCVVIRAPRDVWDRILAPVPPPRFNDIMPARAFGLSVEGDNEMFCQYYPAIRRLVDLLREEGSR